MTYAKRATLILAIAILGFGLSLGLVRSVAAQATAEAPTQTVTPDELDRIEQQAFQAAVTAVADSVVRIETIGGASQVEGTPVGTAPSTGLIVDRNGHIVTSTFNLAHNPTSILVRLPGGKRLAAQVVATDHGRRLALLKINPPQDTELAVPAFGKKRDVRVGQWAITVARTFSPDDVNMTVGVISGKDRIWGRAIQTDAAVSPGNYGGPLIDIHGRVIGIVTPCNPDSQGDAAGLEWYDSGIGFAAPADDLLDKLPELIQGVDQHIGLAGLRFNPATVHTEKAVVQSVFPGSPAAKTGIIKDDRIIGIDGVMDERTGALKTLLGMHYAGEEVTLAVQRGDETLDVRLRLVDELLPFAHGFLGVLPMRDLPAGDAATKRGDQTDNNQSGVVVRYVYPNSPAAQAGISKGDRITMIDDQPITDPVSARMMLQQKCPGSTIEVVWITPKNPGGEQQKVDVVLAPMPQSLIDDTLDSPYARTSNATGNQASGEAAPATALPDTGLIELSIPDFEHEAWAYVPTKYQPDRSYGVVLVLHAPNRFDRDALLESWKPLCDRNDLILLMPQAKGGSWQQTDIEMFRKLIGELQDTYRVDPTRVVAHGQLSGGSIALLTAFRCRDLIRGVATVDSPVIGRPPENTPDEPLAIFMAISDSTVGRRVQKMADAIGKMNYPVTSIELGPASRTLTEKELEQLAKWIDTLDRM